jgi:hypothetical protein
VKVDVPEGVSHGFLPEEMSIPGGFVPGDAVLIGYPAEGIGRIFMQKSPEMLMWIK